MRKFALAGSVAVILVSAITGIGVHGDVRAATAVRYGRTVDVLNFDPTQLPLGNYIMTNQLFSTLVRLDKTLKPTPELAVSWQFLDQGLTLRLSLRRGVVFHSGRPFTADDVVFTVRHYQNPQTAANIRAQVLSIREARKVDDATVDLVFNAPNPAIFDLLDLLYIVDRDTIDRIRTQPVGTGPFRLTDRVPGTLSRFVRFDRFWKRDTPAVDEIEVRVIADDESLVANLTAGSVQIIERPRPTHIPRLERQGFTIVAGASAPLYHDIVINVQRDPFKDRRVRQAINVAIDRERFVRLFHGGRSNAAWLPASVETTGSATGPIRYPKRDPARARALLAEAGLANGLEAVLMVPSEATLAGSLALAQIVQSDLAKIGVRLRLEVLDAAQVRARWFSHDFQISIHAFGRANRDPASLLGTAVVFRPDDNLSLFRSDQYIDLASRAATTIDARARSMLYRQIAQILLDEAFILTIAPSYPILAMAKNIDGTVLNLEGMPILETMHVKP